MIRIRLAFRMRAAGCACAALVWAVPAGGAIRAKAGPVALNGGLPALPGVRVGLVTPALAPARAGLPVLASVSPSAGLRLPAPAASCPDGPPAVKIFSRSAAMERRAPAAFAWEGGAEEGAEPDLAAPSRSEMKVRSRLSRLALGLSAGAAFDGSRAVTAESSAFARSQPRGESFAVAGTGDASEPSFRPERARGAASGGVESPEQIPGETPLEKHAAFFDRDGDGVITVWETRAGLRRLGFGALSALAIATAIHAGLAPTTAGGWWEAARLRIRVRNIAAGRHAGDTGVYDERGRFVPEAFARIFSEFAKSKPDRINEAELARMLEANSARKPGLAGRAAAIAEFSLLLEIAADSVESVDGKALRAISRRRLEQFYDGTLFYRLAR